MKPNFDFDPPIIAHRGASACAPENTMAAFTKAQQLGLKWIECDVMLAKDQPIIFHDDELNRTTNGAGLLHHYDYQYLQTLDAGSWFSPKFSGEAIPNLKQLIAWLVISKMNVNLELKSLVQYEKKLVDQTLAVLNQEKKSISSIILFSSFAIETLYYLRSQSKDALIGLLMDEWDPKGLQIAKELHCVSINLNHEIVTKNLARQIKELGYNLLCYTVNDYMRAMELFAWGVDAVFSDHISFLPKNNDWYT